MAASPPPQSTLWLRHKDPPRLWPIMLLLSGLMHLGLLIGIWPLIIRFDSPDRTSATIPIELIETIPETDVSLSDIEANPASPLIGQAIIPEATEQTQSKLETISLNSEPTPQPPSDPTSTTSPSTDSGLISPPSLDPTSTTLPPSDPGFAPPTSLDPTSTTPPPSDPGFAPPQPSDPAPPTRAGDQIGVSLRIDTPPPDQGRDIPSYPARPTFSQDTFVLDLITNRVLCSPPSPEILQQFSGKEVSMQVEVTDVGEASVHEHNLRVRSGNSAYDEFCKCLVENWEFSPAQGEQGEPISSDYLFLTVSVNWLTQ
ncbi:MAG: hypothetical protein MJA27_17375 [Pseudanabaenales cyanobacterium]|nr:hypothetical protein [Pseudanabaenales cyanobacterium]